CRRPLHRGVRIFDRAGKLGFGCEAVRDRCHDHTSTVRESATCFVGAIERAENKPTAVEVDEATAQGVARAIDANRNRPAWTRDRARGHARYRLRRRREWLGAAARLGGAHGRKGRKPRELIDDRSGSWVKLVLRYRHGPTSRSARARCRR